MMQVKWVPNMHLSDKKIDDWNALQVPVIELSALAEVVEGLIDAEEEMPGEIPQEMYDTIIGGDKDTVAEALRIAVRVTKRNIKQRLLAQLAPRKEGEHE